MTKQGSHKSYHEIVESLMKFLNLYNKSLDFETDFTLGQVIQLISIFQRVLKMKNILLEHLLGIWINLHHSEADENIRAVQRDVLKAVVGQIACLKEFDACVNLDVIVQRLSSPKVRVEV